MPLSRLADVRAVANITQCSLKKVISPVSYQYVYVMKGLSKTWPGGRTVLRNIWLSFLPGAKIGVLGPNGAGKSTLLRVMAGVERDFDGEAWAAAQATVGYLPQEPELDPSKDVMGNVMEAMAETRALLERFNEVSARFAEPLDDNEMNALIEEQGEIQQQIDAAGGWDLERTLEIAMNALRLPPGDADVRHLSGGWREAAGGAVSPAPAKARSSSP